MESKFPVAKFIYAKVPLKRYLHTPVWKKYKWNRSIDF